MNHGAIAPDTAIYLGRASRDLTFTTFIYSQLEVASVGNGHFPSHAGVLGSALDARPRPQTQSKLLVPSPSKISKDILLWHTQAGG